jgi:predicted N-acyltransferase
MDEDRISQAAGAASAVAIRGDVGIERIGAAEWNALVGGSPLVSHTFLSALHETGCASRASGWTPCYLTAWREDKLAGAVPLYAKTHSYGEYVFDWAWANAYHRHGRTIFRNSSRPYRSRPPRALVFSARQTTCATRWCARRWPGCGRRTARRRGVFVAARALPIEAEARACEAAGMVVRNGVQFRWENQGYRDFADFLATFNHDKRKKVKQERRRVAKAGSRSCAKSARRSPRATGNSSTSATSARTASIIRRPTSASSSSSGSGPRCLATSCSRSARAVAGVICAALDVYDAGTLWGRYWGAVETVSGLHFEACYYQAIEFCIERRIGRFEGGAQGVHKLARGLVPITTWSAHAIADREFARAIAAFCARERVDVAHAIDELDAAKPFRNPQPQRWPGVT